MLHQRDELINIVKSLQGLKTSLAFEVEYLRSEKVRLGAAIAIDKVRLEETLAQALMNLKIQRPYLFTLSGPEQIAILLKVILK